MPDNASTPGRAYQILGGIALAVLWIFVLSRTRPAFFDEVPYLDLAARLKTTPSLHHWLVHDYIWPAGPLHPVLHFLLSGGPGWPAPWLRLPNLICFTVLAWWLGRLAWPRGGNLAVFTAALTVPMTWVISGLALTEIPAMTGLVLALALALRLREGGGGPASRLGWHFLLGLGLAIALCGRQTYLLMVPLVVWLGLEGEKHPARSLVAVGAGLLPAILLFITWHGLRGPAGEYATGFKFVHGVYGICYTGAVALWLAPALWLRHWRWTAAGAGVAAVANAIGGWVEMTTLSSAQRFLPAGVDGRWIDRAATIAAVMAGGSFVVVAAREAWLRRDRPTLAYTLGLLLIAAACAGVPHQFSSRYIATGLPLLLLWLAPHLDTGRWGCGRAVLGMLAGLASLVSYYRFAP